VPGPERDGHGVRRHREAAHSRTGANHDGTGAAAAAVAIAAIVDAVLGGGHGGAIAPGLAEGAAIVAAGTRRLKLTNNQSERELRRIATGSKAGLLCGSDRGRRRDDARELRRVVDGTLRRGP